jgi:small subunit ribosomal protein S5
MTNDTQATAPAAPAAPRTASFGGPRSGGPGRGGPGRGGPGRGGPGRPGGPGRGGPRRGDKPRSEFEQRTLQVRRVARVGKGGRRFNFSVAIAAGDRKGRIGIGLGKASDTALAIDKALKDARRNMITVRATATMSIPHEVQAKFSSARITMMPAPGRGVVAGSAVRDCLELAGIKDVNAKILSGSKNKLNIARAAVKALGALKAPRVAKVKKAETTA